MDELERFREAMRRIRGPVRGQGLEELPEDPDSDHVPVELRMLDGEAVTIIGIDRETGVIVSEPGTFTTAPGLHGDLHRREQA